MELKSKYEIEIKNFKNSFSKIKDKRIAIYGIGRRSATLLPGIISDYNIIGLIDKDKSNIGKEICGIKIISIENIEKQADVIIINSDPSNYEIIYKRISDVNIPVYYASGEKANINKIDTSYQYNSYWKNSYDELKRKIDEAEIVSFDIFDTLIMRKIFSPQDVFDLLEEKAKARHILDKDISSVRKTILSECDTYISFDDLWDKISQKLEIDEKQKNDLKQLEMEIDYQLCISRNIIVELFNECKKNGKDVYIISDMYYPMSYIKSLLEKIGINNIDDDHIWISCEKKADKISGSIWGLFNKDVVNNRKCLHIGDNIIGDIDNPKKYGIETYYIMSGKDMLINSSVSDLALYVNSISDSICIGVIISKMFNNPFILCESKGKVEFNSAEIYGYCIYGPLIEKFLLWLYYNSRKDKIDKLLFFARDGYFLEKDYSILSNLLDDGYKQEWCYLPISRRLIYLATIENEQDLLRVVSFPYVGTFADYMKSRFEVNVTDVTAQYNDRQINAVGDKYDILDWISPYKEIIKKEISKERNNYISYLKDNNLIENSNKYGTVDLGYYGTNQYYLQKLTNVKTQGYCLYSCLTKDNVYISDISMKGCFQYGEDYTAERSLAKRKNMYIETFLTAPHGMIRYIDEFGKIICEPDKNSQKKFHIKEEVNSGVKKYINDYLKIYKEIINFKLYVQEMEDKHESIEDIIFYNMLSGMASVSNNILEGFYFDNDFVGGREVRMEI